KLSGMCGRLKCCLNYELDTYLDALDRFPKNADKLQTEAGTAVLVKTDIFKGLMYYGYEHDNGRGKLFAIEAARAHQIREMNKKGEKPADLVSLQSIIEAGEKEVEMDFEDVTGAIELPEEEKRRKRRKKRRKGGNKKKGAPLAKTNNQQQRPKSPDKGKQDDKNRNKRSRRRGGRKKGGNNNNQNNKD
ncbi:MAG: hypothetical protein KDD06_10545, partial [Phaeodactylibacter sp.]|nr:hypothetical protein [Phaeodactylibacter sp.]